MLYSSGSDPIISSIIVRVVMSGRKRDRSAEGSGTGPILLSQAEGSGTGPILLSQAAFLLAHISNSGLVPLSSFSRLFNRWGISGIRPLTFQLIGQTLKIGKQSSTADAKDPKLSLESQSRLLRDF